MNATEGYPYRGDLLKFAQRTNTRFTNNEIASLRSVKTQFGLLVKFSVVRDEDIQYMEHYFSQRGNAIFDRNNDASIIAHSTVLSTKYDAKLKPGLKEGLAR